MRPAIEGCEPKLRLAPPVTKAGESYLVDIDIRTCTYRGFRFRHHCSHLAVTDRSTLLRYEVQCAPVGALLMQFPTKPARNNLVFRFCSHKNRRLAVLALFGSSGLFAVLK